VCENGHGKSDGVLTVKGVNAQGYREIIGVDVAPGEEETIWGAVFADLLANEVCRSGDWILVPFV
jgi:transposase-like protein